MTNHQRSKRKPQATSWGTSSGAEKSPKSDLAFNSLAWYLGRRDHSEKELKTKLSRRYTPEAVNAAIERAHEAKLIRDPNELAEMFGRSLHRQNKGHFAVNRKLKTIGLPELPKDPELEIEKARSALIRKFRLTEENLKLDRPQQEKAYRFLANRGFDHDTIMVVLKDTK